MLKYVFALSLSLLASTAAPAAVVVLGNFTLDELTCTLADNPKKTQTVVLKSGQVRGVRVVGPCTITFPTKPAATTLQLDPYHAYVFVPDPKAGRRLEGVHMPGEMPERDKRPELNPAPPEPLKVPVTLLVDDADPRADALWQRVLRKRFDEAAEIILEHAPIKLEFAGFDTWESDPDLKDMNDLHAEFSRKVRVKAGGLAIGYTSRVKADPKEAQHLIPFGAVKSAPARHILLRESGPRSDPEKVEAMIHHLGLAFGATLIDPEKDPGSVMRSKIADGLALHGQYRFRFDPLNALALNIWADELRQGPIAKPGDATDVSRARFTRVYQALLKLHPGDSLALEYLNDLEREVARVPEPKPKDPALPKVDPPPPPKMLSRDQVARLVVGAVTARAKVGAGTLSGDELTNEYVRAAAVAAWKEDGPKADQVDRMSGLLLGLAIALDDTDALRNDPATAETVKAIEPDADHLERLKLLGNPTLRGRRDWCRRFALGCGLGELLTTASRAERAAIARTLAATDRNFTALAAEFAGIELARRAYTDLVHVRRLTGETTLLHSLPLLGGLRDGVSTERFREEYGDADDPRFEAVLNDIRDRIRKLR